MDKDNAGHHLAAEFEGKAQVSLVAAQVDGCVRWYQSLVHVALPQITIRAKRL